MIAITAENYNSNKNKPSCGKRQFAALVPLGHQ
jgi:hypothetical protein